MGDGCQTESGTGSLLTLVKNGDLHFEVLFEWPFGRDLDQCGNVHLITEIDEIRTRVELTNVRVIGVSSRPDS